MASECLVGGASSSQQVCVIRQRHEERDRAREREGRVSHPFRESVYSYVGNFRDGACVKGGGRWAPGKIGRRWRWPSWCRGRTASGRSEVAFDGG